MLTVITPTGARPEALALCDKWMQHQTDQNFVWVVLDDGPDQSPRPERCDMIVRPRWRWHGENTQHRAMLELLRVTDDSPKIVSEDDDHYTPGYIASMRVLLDQGYGLVGEHSALYYHVGMRQYKEMSNRKHASLCSTAFQGKEAHDRIKKLCDKKVRMIDHQLWREYAGKKKLQATRLSVGIKGLPGRSGIGCGHNLKGGKKDLGLDFLRATIGSNAEYYRGYYGRKL